MAELNLKMIKIFFVVVIAMLVLAMVSGMNILQGAQFVDFKKVSMEWDYIKYRGVLAAETRNNSSNAPASRKAQAVPVLLYHGIITDNDWEEDGTNIALKDFREQMSALKKAGYRTVSIADFREFMRQQKDLPDKSILITFDDGRKDSYYEADPILRALDFNAVMFLITGRSLGENAAGDNFYLGKKELADMIRSKRWEIQSHGDFDHNWMQIGPASGKGHFLSNLIWLSGKNRNETVEEAKARILADLSSSKKKIKNELGQEVFAFAYPFNDYGQDASNFPEAREFLADNINSIYPLTFFQEEENEPIENFPDPKNFMIKRINVDSSISTNKLLDILDDNREKTLPWNDTFWEDHGWRSKWGKARVWGDLTLNESEKKGGNMTVLLGSSLWKDYAVKSNVFLSDSHSVSQIVRYANEENFAACDFDATGISISQKVNGRDIAVAFKEGNYGNLANSDNEIGAQVQGNTLSCFLNGNKELESSLDPAAAPFGGIGFSFWNALSDNAAVRIKKVEVMPLQWQEITFRAIIRNTSTFQNE